MSGSSLTAVTPETRDAVADTPDGLPRGRRPGSAGDADPVADRRPDHGDALEALPAAAVGLAAGHRRGREPERAPFPSVRRPVGADGPGRRLRPRRRRPVDRPALELLAATVPDHPTTHVG